MILGITGTLAAGKGTIVDYFKTKGFLHYSVSDFIKEIVLKRNLPMNRDSMVLIGNELREKNSPSFIVDELYSRAKNSGKNCIIESLRTPGEIYSLKEKDEFYLIAVDAPVKLRYERAIERQSEKDFVSLETFIENEKREFENTDPNKQNLKKCMELANFKIINDGNIEELESKLKDILDKINVEKNKVSKREDYISWDEYFMGVALLSAKRSKDPSTQVGACIVDEDKKIVGTGYNGTPTGIPDEEFPWAREGDYLQTKYPYVCHAELNAILTSTRRNLKACTLYVALCPGNEFAKAIIQSGIKKVIYLSDKYANLDIFIASRKLFELANVELKKLELNKKINIDFKND